MNESVHLGHVGGIRIAANWSLAPIFVLITWSLAATLLPAAAPGYATWGYWAFGVLTAAAFYASLLAHELAHAFAARRHGVRVRSIVLWLFGGVAQLEGDTPGARAELEVAAVGPATSVAIALLGFALASLLGALGVSALMVAAVRWLAFINLVLALFNLLPAFPLDGGRILRAVLWHRWKDRARATSVAAKVGKVGGFGLIAVGAVVFLAGGGALGGIWLAVIGWFIVVAADQQRERVTERSRVGELRVADAMSRDPLSVPASATVADVLEPYVKPSRLSSFAVLESGGRIAGLATVQRMAALPRADWPSTSIMAAAATPAELVLCGPDDAVADVALRMQGSADRRALVVASDRLVGVLTPSDVRRAIARAAVLGQQPGTAATRGPEHASPGFASY